MIALTPGQTFGFSDGQVRRLTAEQASAPVEAHAQVTRVSRDGNQRQLFVPDSAQTWQQIELDPDFAVRSGQAATLSSGALGSLGLSTDSRHRTRVKRIRWSLVHGRPTFPVNQEN